MHSQFNRRTFLRGAGVGIALPLLDAMQPAFGAVTEKKKMPRRMVTIQTNMGILPRYFFPEGTGLDYKPSAYLKRLVGHRKQMTVFSGVSLPGVTGGHAAQRCFLTGTPHPERGGFRNGISHAADPRGHPVPGAATVPWPGHARAPRDWAGPVAPAPGQKVARTPPRLSVIAVHSVIPQAAPHFP